MSAAPTPPAEPEPETASRPGAGNAPDGIPGLRFEVEERGQSTRILDITIPAAIFEDEVQAELRRIRRTARFPGFRKGKAPRDRIEQRFGPQVAEDVGWSLVSRATRECLRDLGASPLAPPAPEGEPAFERGQPLQLKVAFEVWPDIGQVDFADIEVKRRDIPVEEAQILQTLEQIREQKASPRPVTDRGARDGDFVRGDVEETDPDDAAAAPVQREDVVFQVGRNQAPPALNESLQGIRQGDTAVATVGTGPAASADANPAAKRRRIAFRVKEVFERPLPRLDDDLAQAVGAKSLLALRGDVRDRLQQRAREEREQRFHDDVVEALLQRNTVEAPRALVRGEVEAEVRRAAEFCRKAGMKPEEAEQQVRSLLPGIQTRSERRVAMSILLDAVARQQEIEVPEARIEERIAELAASASKTPVALRAALEDSGELEQLRAVETRKAALDYLLEQADAEAQ